MINSRSRSMYRCLLTAPVIPLVLLLVVSPALGASEGNLHEQARSAYEQKQYERAAKMYDRLVEQGQSGYELLFYRARSHAFAGSDHRLEAIEAYTDFLQQHPGDPDGLVGRGRVHTWMGQYEKAETDLRSATRNHPEYADAWNALGTLYHRWGKSSKALRAYDRWSNLKPDDTEPFLARHRVYRSTGNYSLAREELQKAEQRGADSETVNEYETRLRRLVTTEGGLYPHGRWEASVGYQRVGFSDNRDDWNNYTASISRQFKRGSLKVQGLRTQRFNDWDEAVIFDLYHDLWSRSYMNIRYHHAPSAQFLANSDVLFEVYQGVGQGWEVSLFWREMDFNSSDVQLWGGSVAKYTGNWYLRLRSQFRPNANNQVGTSESYQFLVRHYLDTAEDYVELRYQFGKKTLNRKVFPSFSTTERSDSLGLAYRSFPWKHWGYETGGGIGDNDGFRDYDLYFDLMYRW